MTSFINYILADFMKLKFHPFFKVFISIYPYNDKPFGGLSFYFPFLIGEICVYDFL